MTHEPTVQESLEAGVDLVTFSGDKLLGGPQAGIIAGRADLVKKIKRHPLARAVRADKTTYAGLSATLQHYLRGEALQKIPIWQMISADQADLKVRASAWDSALHRELPELETEVIAGESTVGGGSLPGETLPTHLLALQPRNATAVLAQLRAANPPVIARAQDQRILFDPRTVLPDQDDALIQAVQRALKT